MWTTRELWKFEGEESEYTNCTVMAIFGSEINFLVATFSTLVVVLCQLVLIKLLVNFSRVRVRATAERGSSTQCSGSKSSQATDDHATWHHKSPFSAVARWSSAIQ